VLHFEIIVVRRVKPIPRWVFPIISLFLGLLLSTLIIHFLTSGGVDFIEVLSIVFYSLASPHLVLKNFALLTIVGVGLVIGFKAAIWNIGGEGQFYMAMLIATGVALYVNIAQTMLINKILMIALGLIVAGLWALISILPRVYLGVDEVPVTLLCNYIAYSIVDYIVYGPWREPTYRYTRTLTIPRESWFTSIPGTPFTLESLVIACISVFFAWYLLNNTKLGLCLRMMSSNQYYLKMIGVDVNKLIMYGIFISGVLIGVAGVSYLAGEVHLINIPAEKQSPGYGYSGILVAWLSLLDVLYVPISAYIVSALLNAGINLQIASRLGFSVTNIFIGTILLTYSISTVFSEYRVRIIVKKKRV